MSVVCYPQPGKAKSRAILEAFAQGCDGRIGGIGGLEPGAVAFFGVVGIEHLLRMAHAEERTWYYGDNAYFDSLRGKYFRFTRNAMQPSKVGKPDHARARALGIEVQPWASEGDHIVIVEQSEHFFNLTGAHPLWLARLVAELARYTRRPLRIRRWTRDKVKAADGLRKDLEGAHALITYSSAAANEALLAGVPVFVERACAASSLASGPLQNIESPLRPHGREDWAAWLATQQWTLDEIRSGMAWAALQ